MPDSMPTTSILHSAFERALMQHGYTADPAQRLAVDHLAGIHSQLLASIPPGSTLGRLRRRLPGRLARVAPPRGAYLWGSVGRGKTFVMDVFFESLPFDDKLRYHFHRLMYRVHNRLAALVGESDPLEIVADELADQARVICFDEFFVTEIGDAMILGKLLQGLFRRGVCLVATSNTPPAELYSGRPATRTVSAGHCPAGTAHAGYPLRRRYRLPAAPPGTG